MPRPRNDVSLSPDLLTVATLAAMLRAPHSTLRYWRHQGIGPRSSIVGNRIVYATTDVRAWIDEAKQQQRMAIHAAD